jgi:hypothetical protein
LNDANLTQPNEIYDSRSLTTLRDIQHYKPVLYLELYMPRAEPYNIEINLCFKVNILLKRENHLHDLLISLGCDICAYKASLTSPLFIEVPVWSQDNGVPCLCVLDNSGIDLVSYWELRLDFGTVPTKWGFCLLFIFIAHLLK